MRILKQELPVCCTEKQHDILGEVAFLNIFSKIEKEFEQREITSDNELYRWYKDARRITVSLEILLESTHHVSAQEDTDARGYYFKGMCTSLFIIEQYLKGDHKKINLFNILCDINDNIPHIDFADFMDLAKEQQYLAKEHKNISPQENLQVQAFRNEML